MRHWSEDTQQQIVREYFGPAGAGEPSLCPGCGQDLDICSTVLKGFGLQLRVKCPGCEQAFTWLQPQPVRAWKTLHLDYFAERYLMEETIRCPYDDCYVSWAEFNDRVVQFICPYCNRRGRIIVEPGHESGLSVPAPDH